MSNTNPLSDSASNSLMSTSNDTVESPLSAADEVELRKYGSKLWIQSANPTANSHRQRDIPRTSFHIFSHFPTEIRRLIWKEALTAPHVIVMYEYRPTRSQVNFTMQTCREARDIGLSLRLPYFQLSPDLDWQPEDPKYYFNPSVDTIWIEDDCVMLESIEFFCGTCPQSVIFPMLSDELSEFPKCSHNLRLNRLALTQRTWDDPERGGTSDRPHVGSTDILRHLNSVRELYLVVGDTTVARQGGIAFDVPKTVRFQDLVYDDIRRTLLEPPENGSDPAAFWERAEVELEETFRIFKQDRADQRKIELEEYERDEEEMDENDFMDISSWEPPKVRFVEALST